MPEVPSLPDQPELTRAVAEAFADGGALASALPAFEARHSQRAMATSAAELFEHGGVLLAEAGTGTGKTLAYLVPAILSRQRVLVSTGTKNLQDQIFYKDLPTLRAALDMPFTAAYMKGRGNYLCLHRFAALQGDDGQRAAIDAAYIAQIAEWAEQTETGDRAEIEDLPDNLAIWHDVSATSENCIGTECPSYQECFVTKMRQRAAESDLVIVNHHLLCADAAVRQSDYGEVIPACSYAVIDEAHQLEDVATQYFGVAVSNHRLDDLERDVRRVLGDVADLNVDDDGVRELRDLLDQVLDAGRFFFGALTASGVATDRSRLTPDAIAPVAEPGRRVVRALEDLARAVLRGRGVRRPAGARPSRHRAWRPALLSTRRGRSRLRLLSRATSAWRLSARVTH